MDHEHSAYGAGRAALCAGPTFVLSLTLTSAMAGLPNPWLVNTGLVMGIVLLTLLSIIVGSVLAFLPSLIASAVLGSIGHAHPLVRPLALWLAAGGAIGWSIGQAFGGPIEVMVALVVTSMASAAWCHRAWRWD